MHEMSNPVFWKNEKSTFIYLLSAELAQRVVKVKAVIVCYQILNTSLKFCHRFVCH